MKNITILVKDELERSSKGGYFKEVTKYVVLENTTELKTKSKLEELNKNARSRYYKIFRQFNLTTKSGMNEFIKFIFVYDNIFELNKYNQLINNFKNSIKEAK